MTDHRKTIALAAAIAAFASTAAPAKDLTIGVSAEASSIDPHFHALTPNIQVRWNTFESLIAQDATQAVRPALAENGRRWTIPHGASSCARASSSAMARLSPPATCSIPSAACRW